MITALSPDLPVRTAIIIALQSDAALTSIVSTRIFPTKTPSSAAYPFIRVVTPIGSPQWLDGTEGGSELTGTVHCYAIAQGTIFDPEAKAAEINAHVVRILNGMEVLIEGELSLGIHPTITQVIQDEDEASAYHGIVSYRALAT